MERSPLYLQTIDFFRFTKFCTFDFFTIFFFFFFFLFKFCLTLTAELLLWRRRPSSVRPSVRKLMFLGNRCLDPGQILWAAPYPLYLQTIFFSKFSVFKILRFYFFFVNMVPYGTKHSKTLILLLPFLFNLSQTLS